MATDGQVDSGPAEPEVTAASGSQGRKPVWTPGQRSRRAKGPTVATGKRPLKLSITNDAHEKLALHALKSGVTISELVEGLASTHLTQWVIHAKPGRQP
jgi:hypothetical protein